MAGHGVHHEQNVRGVHRFFYIFQLIHERFIDLQTACGIDDDVIVAVVARVANGRLRDLHRVFGAHLKDGYAGLCAHDL